MVVICRQLYLRFINVGEAVRMVMLACVLLYQPGVCGLNGGVQRLVMKGELIVPCAVQGH